MEKITKIFEQLGIEPEILKDENAINIEDVVQKVQTNIQSKLNRDEKFIETHRKFGEERARAQMTEALKNAYGITEIAQDKPISDLLIQAKEFVTRGMTMDSKVLQEKVIELSKEKDALQAQIPLIQSQSQRQITEYKKEIQLQKMLSSHNLILSAERTLNVIKPDLEAKYNILYENDNIIFTTKDGQSIYRENGIHKKTTEDILKEELEKVEGLVRVSNANKTPQATQNIVVTTQNIIKNNTINEKLMNNPAYIKALENEKN